LLVPFVVGGVVGIVGWIAGAVALAAQDDAGDALFTAEIRGNALRVVDAVNLPPAYLSPAATPMRAPAGVGLPRNVPAEVGRWLALEAWSRSASPGPTWTQQVASNPGVASGTVFDETRVVRTFEATDGGVTVRCASTTVTLSMLRPDPVGSAVYQTDAAMRWARIIGQRGVLSARWRPVPEGVGVDLIVAHGARVPGTGASYIDLDLHCDLQGATALSGLPTARWRAWTGRGTTWMEVAWLSQP
jgi:hypothetical protein